MLMGSGDRRLPAPSNRSIFAASFSLPSPHVLLKADNAESFSPVLRRQHIDFVLDEVSETSFTLVVIMVEHQCLTCCTSPPYSYPDSHLGNC